MSVRWDVGVLRPASQLVRVTLYENPISQVFTAYDRGQRASRPTRIRTGVESIENRLQGRADHASDERQCADAGI